MRPDGFPQLTPYCFVNDAAAFVRFLVDALGGAELQRSLRPDGAIANAMVAFDGITVMTSEASAEFPAMPGSYYLWVADVDAAIARCVEKGATVVMPAGDMPYGERQGGVRDPFGNLWWISKRTVAGPYAHDPSADSRVARTSRVVAATPAQVWDAIRDPAKLARWWGPEGFTNEFESHDFRVGGDWKFVMRGPQGAAYPNHQRFVALDAPRRFVTNHVNMPHYVLTVTLTSEGAGTRVDWRQEFESDDLFRRVAEFVRPANEQNLDRLEAVLREG
ncbi:MAG: SRPBCC domain-containing protein [Candidatus Eisenbacteria bacterium]